MRRLFIVIIGLYQYVLSPLFPRSCRFSPSCSEYSKEAIRKYGTLRGLMMSVRRIMKCHPFHPGGYDPVR